MSVTASDTIGLNSTSVSIRRQSEHLTETTTPNRLAFRELARRLAFSSCRERRGLISKAAGHIKSSRDQPKFISILIDECINGDHSYSIDTAVDILAKFGELVKNAAIEFLVNDYPRCMDSHTHERHLHDSAWTILIRALGDSGLPSYDVTSRLLLFWLAENGTPIIREAVASALGVVGESVETQVLEQITVILERMKTSDEYQFVRQTAEDALSDLEAP